MCVPTLPHGEAGGKPAIGIPRGLTSVVSVPMATWSSYKLGAAQRHGPQESVRGSGVQGWGAGCFLGSQRRLLEPSIIL